MIPHILVQSVLLRFYPFDAIIVPEGGIFTFIGDLHVFTGMQGISNFPYIHVEPLQHLFVYQRLLCDQIVYLNVEIITQKLEER